MKKIYQSLILASALGLAFTGFAVAGKNDCDSKLHKPHPSHMQKGAHTMHMPPPMKPFYLEHIALTAAQEEKVFALTHASVPEMRATLKKQQALRRELRVLVETDEYTESKARKIAESLASLERQHVMAKSTLGHNIYSLLTDDQKKQVHLAKKHKPNHGGMIPSHPHHTQLNSQDMQSQPMLKEVKTASAHYM